MIGLYYGTCVDIRSMEVHYRYIFVVALRWNSSGKINNTENCLSYCGFVEIAVVKQYTVNILFRSLLFQCHQGQIYVLVWSVYKGVQRK